MQFKSAIYSCVVASMTVVSSNAGAALIDRGGGLIYDSDLDITWLQDANYAKTSGHDPNGNMTWGAAMTWASQLEYAGYTGWRLPTVMPINGTSTLSTSFSYDGSTDFGYNISAPGTVYEGSTGSELAHLILYTLGNRSYCNPSGYCYSGNTFTNFGPFNNLTSESSYYWTDTTHPHVSYYYINFRLDAGRQDSGPDYYNMKAWAVHDGDIAGTASAVPLPAALYMFGSGLLCLMGLINHRRQS